MQNLKGPQFKLLSPIKSGNPSKLPNLSITIMFEKQAAISVFHSCSPKYFDGFSSSSLACIFNRPPCSCWSAELGRAPSHVPGQPLALGAV